MRKSRRASGNGPNQSLLLRRVKDCKHYQSVHDVVKYLQSRYPEYKRIGGAVLAKSIERALSELKCKRYDAESSKEAEVRPSLSSSISPSFESDSESERTGGQVSDSSFNLMNSMLRKSYVHGGVGRNETGDSRMKKEKKNVEVLYEQEVDPMKAVSALGKLSCPGGIKDLVQEQGRGRVYPMFRDFGGMDEVLEKLIRRVLIPLHYLNLRIRLKEMRGGLPTGILLHGPPGCGKTKLAQAIANETGLPFYEIAAPQIVSAASGQSEENIRELFSKARKTSPSIIFIDEIDAISEKRENLQKGMEGRIVTQLLKCMDNTLECASPAGLEGSNHESQLHTSPANGPDHVLVIGATNRSHALDPALRRPGRFTWEIELHAPDENARFEILSVLTRNLAVQGGLDLRKLARDTKGFVGADLEECVSTASLLAMNKLVDSKKAEAVKESACVPHVNDWWKRLNFTHEELETIGPTMADFEAAVESVQPSLKREGFSLVPDVKWEDVGGYDKIRLRFQRTIVRSITCPNEGYRENVPAGFLHYGPPGCGKTLIGSAVANEAGASFIYIKGPELMRKYVGESELAVRELFNRARMCSPCIIFFDEVDSLTANCEESSGVTDRVLKQLLIELDGAEKRRGVYVIGATNRPHLMDRALLRPGRFEELLYVALPNPEERGLILKALAEKKHLGAIDASVDLLAIGKSKRVNILVMRCADEVACDEIESLNQTSSEAIPLVITIRHFEKALVGMTPVIDQQREFYDRLSQSFSAA